MKSPGSTAVPKPMQAAYDAVVALTDTFSRDHLTDEYRHLARAMAASLSRKRPSPLASGQPRTWACGIIHVLGQLNFLSDKATQPYMTMAEVCTAFGVGQDERAGAAQRRSGSFQRRVPGGSVGLEEGHLGFDQRDLALEGLDAEWARRHPTPAPDQAIPAVAPPARKEKKR